MISERQQKLLERIIREYVQTAEPVSSKSLVDSGFLGVSSATIRSEMNELERAGYLDQPHTSAGRVPSDKAYRFYVDKLVKAEPLAISTREKHKIDQTIQEAPRDPHRINKLVAQMLSELSDHLVITNILDQDDFYKVGLKSLFEHPEFREIERAFRLTSFFDDIDEMFGEMVREMRFPHEVTVYIGRESPFEGITDESVICAEYCLPNNCTGSVIMVGPTRMNYQRNMGLLKYTAEELNELYG